MKMHRVAYSEPDAGATLSMNVPGGIEMLVLKGSILVANDSGQVRLAAFARAEYGNRRTQGAKLWIKSGHLPHAKAPAS